MKYLSLAFLVFVTCSAFSQNEKLEIDGAIIIANTATNNPEMGTIRFNAQTNDFEGFNGQWISLTNGPFNDLNQVRDIDGNVYRTVQIGVQVWMRENLRTTSYRNGDPIKELTFDADWTIDTIGAWCWFQNDSNYDQPYGKLYNWYAVVDTSGLCPAGWKIPELDDFNTLFLTLVTDQGRKMKEAGTANWNSPNTGDNESGFSGVGSGWRIETGIFAFFKDDKYLWTQDESGQDNGIFGALRNTSSSFVISNELKNIGMSVRCLKE